MKAIQITVDDALLARLDRDPEVKRLGRSAVFRRAVEAWLRHRRKAAIAGAYQKAYAGRRRVLDEFDGWTEEGVWPDR